MLFANSDMDPIFQMDGNRRIIDRLRRLYKMYDRPELVDDYVSKGGHAYRPDLRMAIFKFINKHVKNDTGPVKDIEFTFMPDEKLRVFPEDKDLPKDALNNKIDETFVPLAQVKLPEEGKFGEWKKGLMKELEAKSFQGFKRRIPEGGLVEVDSGGLQRTDGFVTSNMRIMDKDGLTFAGLSFAGKTKVDPKSETLVLLEPTEDVYSEPPDWAKPFAGMWKEVRTPVVHVRGNKYAPWTEKSPPNYIKRAHVLSGQTVDQTKVGDLIATIHELGKKHPKKAWKVVGRSQAGILAAYAALFEPSISEVVIIDPPVSHRDGPIFLNVLRVCDIPEALGMLAPRKLTLVNAKDKTFDRTAQIYKLAGAEAKLQRK
jgi:hypothetical protein